jgi:hypothetical protein
MCRLRLCLFFLWVVVGCRRGPRHTPGERRRRAKQRRFEEGYDGRLQVRTRSQVGGAVLDMAWDMQGEWSSRYVHEGRRAVSLTIANVCLCASVCLSVGLCLWCVCVSLIIANVCLGDAGGARGEWYGGAVQRPDPTVRGRLRRGRHPTRGHRRYTNTHPTYP